LCQPIVNKKPASADTAAQDRMPALPDCCEHRLELFDEQADVVIVAMQGSACDAFPHVTAARRLEPV
jgi:hypothetical protein